MMAKYQVLIDRGFRGVAPGQIGEWDASDAEVAAMIERNFLAPAPPSGDDAAVQAGETKEEG